MKLTKREKVLLFTLGMVLFWYLIASMLILPMLSQTNTLKLELGDLQQKKQQIQLYLDSFQDMNQKIQDAEKQKEAEAFFYRDIDSVFVGRFMQQLSAKHSVQVMSTQITNPDVTAVDPYYENQRVMSYPIKDQQNLIDGTSLQKANTASNESASSSDASAQGSQQLIPMFSCTIMIQAQANDVVAFVEEIKNLNRSVVVASVGTGGKQNITDGVFADSITVNFYFIES